MKLSFEFARSVILQADIVQVISTYIDVIKKGNNYVAVCPFHNDTRPSLSISPQKGIYKCFSCGKGGNVIHFVQEYEKISYQEAIVKVCNICHIPLPKDFTIVKRVNPNQKLIDILTKTRDYYILNLKQPSGKVALDYLHDRGLDDSIIDHFKIGYAPQDNKKLIQVLSVRQGFTHDEITRAGVLSNQEFGDKFRNRIMFPISNRFGEVVGFSGRKLSNANENDPKYINSADSKDLFDKSKLLYHFYEASKVAVKEQVMYIVEGFMDCIALYRAGIENCVALMGVNLSEQHMAMLKSLRVKLNLLLDSDNAGQGAMLNLINKLDKAKINCSVVKPYIECKDSDEYIKKFGGDKLRERVNQLVNPIIFKFDYMVNTGRSNSDQIEKLISDSTNIYAMSSSLDKEQILDRISSYTGVSKKTIDNLFNNYNKKSAEIVESKVNEFTDFIFVSSTENFLKKDVLVTIPNSNANSRIQMRKLKSGCNLLKTALISKETVDRIRQDNVNFGCLFYKIINSYIMECSDIGSSNDKLSSICLEKLEEVHNMIKSKKESDETLTVQEQFILKNFEHLKQFFVEFIDYESDTEFDINQYNRLVNDIRK